jgi:transcriptional regulator with XRE-family HTH domain
MSDHASIVEAKEEVQSKFESEKLLAERLQSPDLDTLRDFVRFVDGCIVIFNEAAGLEDRWASLIRANALQSSFPVAVSYRHGRPRWACEQLFALWNGSLAVWGYEALNDCPVQEQSERRLRDFVQLEHDIDYLTTFHLAVSEVLTESVTGSEARAILERLRATLDLSFDDLGRVFRVSGETVRRWERGSSILPADQMATLASTDAALDRLLHILKPERLAQVITRSADLFDGRSARELILSGQIDQVADRYEVALRYQG